MTRFEGKVMLTQHKRASVALLGTLLIGTSGCGDFGTNGWLSGTGGRADERVDEPVVDTDADGVADDRDPSPRGSTDNKLKSVLSGGAARVVAIEPITMGDGWDLEAGCDDPNAPQAVLCDADDSLSFSRRSLPGTGPAWIPNGEDRSGALVVDACYDGSCSAIDFNEARVFQTYCAGKTTHVRLSVHDERGDEPPAWDDEGWRVIVDEEPIVGGRDAFDDAATVGGPTVFATGAHVSRYVRIEVSNDGSLDGDPSVIRIRAVKLFSVSIPEIDPDLRRVFVSSETYDGNLGGLSGADEACQALADASLRVSGSFKAFLPHDEQGVGRLEHSDATYVRPDDSFIAGGFESLAHDAVQWPLDLDQNLNRVPPSKVWTGYGCENFTSTSGYAGISSTNSGLAVKGIEPCDHGGMRVYCIEQQ